MDLDNKNASTSNEKVGAVINILDCCDFAEISYPIIKSQKIDPKIGLLACFRRIKNIAKGGEKYST